MVAALVKWVYGIPADSKSLGSIHRCRLPVDQKRPCLVSSQRQRAGWRAYGSPARARCPKARPFWWPSKPFSTTILARTLRSSPAPDSRLYDFLRAGAAQVVDQTVNGLSLTVDGARHR